MTIRLRNRLIRMLFYFFIAVLGVTAAFFLLQIFRNHILDNPNFLNQGWELNFSLTKSWFWASCGSNFFLLIFEIVICFLLFSGFEKTQSQEICFLACFLLGCCAESLKLWVPIFNTYTSFSKMLIFTGDATILSRFLVTISLFFCALFSGPEQRQHLEQNLIIVFSVSFFIAGVLPLNTASILNSFQVSHSFYNIVKTVQILINLVTLITVYLNDRREGDSFLNALGLLLLISGFYIIAGCSTVIWGFFGAAFMVSGVIIYLKQLHIKSSI